MKITNNPDPKPVFWGAKIPRVSMPCQPAADRICNFSEVALGYTLEQAQAEASRCLQCKKPFCVAGCPVEVEIKEFIAAIARQLEEATALFAIPTACPLFAAGCALETQCEGECILARKRRTCCHWPLGTFCGRSLHCRQPLRAAYWWRMFAFCPPLPPSKPPVLPALALARPALLALATLPLVGAKVTIFEALHEPGGVLVYGIPEFRLPKSIVAEELGALAQLGVEFRNNWVGGRTFSVQELLDDGYDAVFIGLARACPFSSISW